MSDLGEAKFFLGMELQLKKIDLGSLMSKLSQGKCLITCKYNKGFISKHTIQTSNQQSTHGCHMSSPQWNNSCKLIQLACQLKWVVPPSMPTHMSCPTCMPTQMSCPTCMPTHMSCPTTIPHGSLASTPRLAQGAVYTQHKPNKQRTITSSNGLRLTQFLDRSNRLVETHMKMMSKLRLMSTQ
jgi:hypothetical protein